ncbi:MerR family transcriptional regulator [Marmoricola sp. Leaf446]|uniref:MerR family transcriptional regulator n=1 Tax=Marmoricola sp. Leaf446 TaxID=1736379 RepID=UPI000B14243A|nr:MerR family transcriptional regulator [Marmoricola sp. Leaf446]
MPRPPTHHRGVYAISVAAEMVAMQVQNLRVYERRGLLRPDRTEGGTRLYSAADIDTLHRIRDLLAEGLNLVGVARVLDLEAENARLRARLGSRPRARGHD